jgi:5-methylcytosine-specific restriction protein A
MPTEKPGWPPSETYTIKNDDGWHLESPARILSAGSLALIAWSGLMLVLGAFIAKVLL